MSSLPEPGTLAAPFALADLQAEEQLFPGSETEAVQLLFFFKHDCETCQLVAPAVEALYRALGPARLRVLAVSQDDLDDARAFAVHARLTPPVVRDDTLEISSIYGFDAVPTLVLTQPDGTVLARFEGWVKADWVDLARRAADACGLDSADPEAALSDVVAIVEDLPGARPGCGSRAHDPDVTRRLAVVRGALTLGSRRVPIPVDDDAFEFLFDQGLTDGLPVIPPTEDRVLRMLDGTSRAPSEVVAHVPPNLAPATVEKVAINAVMAGCLPEYLPVVLAAVEAACTSEFNLHGVLATTYFVGPVIVVNGPIRHAIGINSGGNAFGQGSRANATIGRALQLIVRNVGGGRPGEVDMSTLGQPGKFTCCIGENEEASCWAPLHVERGYAASDSTVTLLAGEAPRAIRDQLSRSAASLATSFGLSLEGVAHVKLHGISEAMLVISPEHVRTLERDGFSKNDVRAQIQATTSRPLRELLPNDACQKGLLPRALPAEWLDSTGQPLPEALDRRLPKFRRDDDILIVVAGSSAGKFSAVVGGWASGGTSSTAVTTRITS